MENPSKLFNVKLVPYKEKSFECDFALPIVSYIHLTKKEIRYF